MGELGFKKPLLTEAQRSDEFFPEARADHTIFINGRKIECFDDELTSKIFVDGKRWDGSYLSAIQACGVLPRKERRE